MLAAAVASGKLGSAVRTVRRLRTEERSTNIKEAE